MRQKTDEQRSNKKYGDESYFYKLISYNPTYILPFYYTVKPDDVIYKNNTPRNQKLRRIQFKVQFSFQVPLMSHLCGSKNSLNFIYTQDSFWQAYSKLPFFRESNYMLELFLRSLISATFIAKLGVVH